MGCFPSYMSIISDDRSDLEEETPPLLCGYHKSYGGSDADFCETADASAEKYSIIKFPDLSREIPRELVDMGQEAQEKKKIDCRDDRRQTAALQK